MKVYNILASSSKGNAILYLDNKILVDIGVPYTTIKDYVDTIEYVFISHKHSDHIRDTTVKTLYRNKPTVKFLIGEYLYDKLIELGIKKSSIHIVENRIKYTLNETIRNEKQEALGKKRLCDISFVKLYHNVDNLGIRMYFGDNKRLFHATDTYTLEGIVAKDYDYYMVERNYCEELIDKEIEDAKLNDRFTYAFDSKENHLSKQNLYKWLELNNVSGEVVYLHQSTNFLDELE